MTLPDVYRALHAKDRPYFRTSREARFGTTLEDLAAHRQAYLDELKRQPPVAGGAPNYADYYVFGMFMRSRCVTDVVLVEPGDPIHAWPGRLLDLLNGFASKAPIHH